MAAISSGRAPLGERPHAGRARLRRHEEQGAPAPTRSRAPEPRGGCPGRRRDSAVRLCSPGNGAVRPLCAIAPRRRRGRPRALVPQRGGLDAGRGDGREERSLNGLVDLDPADRQVRHAPPRDELPAGAVIARARVRALVVHGEAPPAVPARSDPLQERRALPERTAWLMGLWADVGTDAGLVGFEGCPVDVAGVMIHDQDRPPVASDATPLDTGSTRLVNDTLVSRAPIDIGASVGRMREHAVDRVVGGCNPPELGPGVPRRLLQREREPLAEQPQPHSPHGAGLCEVAEDGPYHATHRLIRVEEHLAVPLPPYEPDRKAPAELTSCRLVRIPPSSRARSTCSSASLIVPSSPTRAGR